MATQLFFDYGSTARIRIKKCNCFYNEEFPCVYRIKTEKLDFLIPRKATIFSGGYVYIPNDEYKKALSNYYQNVRM